MDGEYLPPAPPAQLEEFRRLIWEKGPAVLDAVAAFMYGITVIAEAFERLELGDRGRDDDG